MLLALPVKKSWYGNRLNYSVCETTVVMSTLAELITKRKKDLVGLTDCTTCTIAAFEPHLNPDRIEQMVFLHFVRTTIKI